MSTVPLSSRYGLHEGPIAETVACTKCGAPPGSRCYRVTQTGQTPPPAPIVGNWYHLPRIIRAAAHYADKPLIEVDSDAWKGFGHD